MPVPVAPATSRCGIFARSASTGLPKMSLPSASVSFDALVRKLSRLEQVADVDDLALGVRHLDADHRLARERRDDADRERAQREREIVRRGS